MKRPLCLDLFSGAGGTAIGLRRAGFDVVHFEWDADACATLRAAFPGDDVHEGDLRKSPWESWAGKVHLLWSSFPCQAWSTSGKRVGARDERNGWPWTVEAIDRSRPTWVLCENVEGLRMHRGGVGKCGGDPDMCPGCYFDGIILPQLRERFAHVSWRLLDAADYGVPQRRHRIILAAGPQPFPWPTPTHCDPSFLIPIQRGQRLPWVSVRTALNLDEVLGTDHQLVARNSGHSPATVNSVDLPSPTVIAPPQGTYDRLKIRTEFLSQVTDDPKHAPVSVDAPANTPRGGGDGHGGALDLFADDPSEHADDPQARTVRVRRVTVTECAVLQGFPADHPFQGNQGARYKQVGNAVSPPVAEALGKIVAGLI